MRLRHRIHKGISTTLDVLYHLTTGRQGFMRHYRKPTPSKLAEFETEPKLDMVFVLPPEHVSGWVLDATCQEIEKYFSGTAEYIRYPAVLPPAKCYFYSHYSYFRGVLINQPEIIQARNVLWYTHPKEDLWFSEEEMLFTFESAYRVVCMCTMWANELKKKGVKNLSLAYVGADANMFTPHDRQTKRIGFSSGYVPRKSGDRILELVQSMPDHEFVLCGPRWRDWHRFPEMLALENFKHLELKYAEYPDFYHSIDVFVSLSDLEGGPISLIEAAMSNVVPVCSKTGHAPDLIKHGDNGYLFDIDAPISVVRELVLKALANTNNIRQDFVHLTWENYSKEIQKACGFSES